jgi:hypothetical protein
MDENLPDNYPSMPERDLLDVEKITFAHGYRKSALLYAEFLAQYGDVGREVVIVGGVPGVELCYLAKLFPTHRFIVYDVRVFHESVRDYKNIIIKQRFFTDRDADDIATSTKLFICNLFNYDAAQGHSWSARRSFEMMTTWCKKLMYITRALLIFRIPYDEGDIEFYDGDMAVAPWGKERAAPLFISTDCKTTRVYQPLKILAQTFNFNTCARWGWYPSLTKLTKYDHCYDCWRETGILLKYMKLANKPNFTLQRLSDMLDEDTYTDLTTPPHGMFKGIKNREEKITALAPHTLQHKNATAESLELYNNIVQDIGFIGAWRHSEWEKANAENTVDVASYGGR